MPTEPRGLSNAKTPLLKRRWGFYLWLVCLEVQLKIMDLKSLYEAQSYFLLALEKLLTSLTINS
jgi:hypothetical protein